MWREHRADPSQNFSSLLCLSPVPNPLLASPYQLLQGSYWNSHSHVSHFHVLLTPPADAYITKVCCFSKRTSHCRDLPLFSSVLTRGGPCHLRSLCFPLMLQVSHSSMAERLGLVAGSDILGKAEGITVVLGTRYVGSWLKHGS